jgi:hypothetical protein
VIDPDKLPDVDGGVKISGFATMLDREAALLEARIDDDLNMGFFTSTVEMASLTRFLMTSSITLNQLSASSALSTARKREHPQFENENKANLEIPTICQKW